MLIRHQIPRSTWAKYSKKLCEHIYHPQNVGFFTLQDAEVRGTRLCVGKEGEVEDRHVVYFYLLVSEADGMIVDAKFQVYGNSALIGAADATAEILKSKNYMQARRLSADFIDKFLCDKKEATAFPQEIGPILNLLLAAIDNAVEKCEGIPYVETYESPPVSSDIFESEGIFPGWEEMGMQQRIQVIEEVVERDIRPYIELDAGGVKVLSLVEGKEVMIAYEGSCTSCYSATGSTLNAIQQILRAKVHPELIVTPDLSFLKH